METIPNKHPVYGGTVTEDGKVEFTVEELTHLTNRFASMCVKTVKQQRKADRPWAVFAGAALMISIAPLFVSAFGVLGLFLSVPVAVFVDYVFGRTFEQFAGWVRSPKKK